MKKNLLAILFCFSNLNSCESIYRWEVQPPRFLKNCCDYTGDLVLPYVRPHFPISLPEPDKDWTEFNSPAAEDFEFSDPNPYASSADPTEPETPETYYIAKDGTKHSLLIPQVGASKSDVKKIIGYLITNPPFNKKHPDFPCYCLESNCRLPREKHGTAKNASSLHAHLAVYCSRNPLAVFPCPECSCKRRYFTALWAHYIETHL